MCLDALLTRHGRWMQWVPEDNAWTSYIKMELRYREVSDEGWSIEKVRRL